MEIAQPKLEKSSNGMATAGRLLGAVGMVLLVSTPLTWFLTEQVGALLLGKILLGAIFVGFYIATNNDVFSRMAGARSTGLLALTGASVVVAVALVGVVNYIALKNPKEFDLTQEGIYTLSDQTRGVLGRLKEDLKVYAFVASSEPNYSTFEETLKRYKDASPKFSFEMIDPQSRPDLTKQYSISEGGPRIVLVSKGQDARAKDTSEEELTNGIVKVSEQTSKAVFFLTGHGEADLNDKENAEGYNAIAEAIRSEGYSLEPLSLIAAKEAAPGTKVELKPEAGHDGHGHGAEAMKAAVAPTGELEIPGNVAVLVIAGARKPLFPPEVGAIERYVNKGGRVFVLVEPDSDAGLSGFLSQWKIGVQNDLVVDTNPLNRMLGLGPASPMAQPPEEHIDHPVLKTMAAPVVLATARSLKVNAGGQGGVETIPLLVAGESAWGETDYGSGQAARDEKDNVGAVPLMLAASKDVVETVKLTPQGRVVAVGDSEWVNNKYVSMQGNGDMFLNVLNWLAEEQEKISIRPKMRASSQLFLSGDQMAQLKFFSLDILPVLIVAMGLGIVLIRRQR